MSRRYMLLAVLLLALSSAGGRSSIVTAADSSPSDLVLDVWAVDGNEVRITRQMWAQAARTRVKAVDHHGRPAEFEGVTATEVLKRADAPLGARLRGKALAVYMVAEGADGYRAVYALPELDAEFTDQLILIADRKDGKPLDTAEGPLRMVIPGDKREARWVRNLVSLRLLRAP
jgi:hypothetical protein